MVHFVVKYCLSAFRYDISCFESIYLIMWYSLLNLNISLSILIYSLVLQVRTVLYDGNVTRAYLTQQTWH
jgi:hypothetical protein